MRTAVRRSRRARRGLKEGALVRCASCAVESRQQRRRCGLAGGAGRQRAGSGQAAADRPHDKAAWHSTKSQLHLGQRMQSICPLRGERAGVPPSLSARCTSRHTGASAHARRHVCTRLLRRRHQHRPVQGLGFMICEYFILLRHSARRRHHDAFGAAIPPSLIQCWNDTNNGKVFADSIFEIIYVRTLLNPGWSRGQLLNY